MSGRTQNRGRNRGRGGRNREDAKTPNQIPESEKTTKRPEKSSEMLKKIEKNSPAPKTTQKDPEIDENREKNVPKTLQNEKDPEIDEKREKLEKSSLVIPEKPTKMDEKREKREKSSPAIPEKSPEMAENPEKTENLSKSTEILPENALQTPNPLHFPPSCPPSSFLDIYSESDKYVKSKKETGHTQWCDVTSFIKEATDQLALGQIIRDNSLSLYDAMSAFELMDPKMDAGVKANEILTLEEGLESGKLKKSSSLTACEILGLMDKLLELELMWYNGAPISQTLLTCLYFQKSEQIVDERFLKEYCNLLLHRSSNIRQSILIADIYHEEDFFSHLFGFDLPSPDISEKSVIGRVKEMESELLGIEKEGKKGELTYPEGLEGGMVNAFLTRIRFSKTWYSLQKAFSKSACRGLVSAKKLISTLRTLIPHLESTFELGVIPENSIQPEICRRLSHASHPRIIQICSFKEHLAQFQKMLNHLELLCDIATYDSFEKLNQFIYTLGEQGASIVVRSNFINLVISENKIFGLHPHSEFVTKNGKETFEIPDKWFRPDLFPEFFSNLEKMFLRELLVLASNKARRRRKLAHLMRDWSYLVEDGDSIDTRLALEMKLSKEQMPHYFYCWLVDKVLRNMITWIKLGFELELYDPYEDHILFWYMDDLYTQRFRNNQYVLTINKTQKVNSEGRKKKKPVKAKPPKAKDKEAFNIPHHLEIKVEAQLCKAIYLFLSSLKKENKLFEQPQFHFGTPSNRFLIRFEPFYKLRAVPPYTYKQYESQSDFSKVKIDTLLQAATESLQRSKAAIEKYSHHPNAQKSKVEDYKSLFKVCVANTVQISLLVKDQTWAKPTWQQKKATIEYKFDPHYPVITIR